MSVGKKIPIILIIVAFFSTLWIILTSYGEAYLLFAPADEAQFRVYWDITLTDTIGTSLLSRIREHIHRAEAELTVRKLNGNYRLAYTITRVDKAEGVFAGIGEGSLINISVDEAARVVTRGETLRVSTESSSWRVQALTCPPYLFWLIAPLNRRRVRVGEEWSSRHTVKSSHFNGEVEFRFYLAYAPFSTALIKGEVVRPKVLHLPYFAMELTDSEVEVEFDKEGRFIRYIYIYGLLESVSGARVWEFEASMSCDSD